MLTLQKDGWLGEAKHMPSPHHDSRPADCEINLLVVHGISLPAGVFGGDAIMQLFCGNLNYARHPEFSHLQNLRVSAHFLIRRDGELIQFVSCHRRAWHAGQSTFCGRKNCNDFSIGVELEGADNIAYAAPQYAMLQKLIVALHNTYPPLKVVGHQHIAPQRKTDPGRAFDWRQLFDNIGDDYDGRPADL